MTQTMERGGGIALWRQIAERIRAEIAAGVHAPGARLPPEGDLAARFGVNRHTLRRAMATLAAEGVVRVDQGRGTFVEAGRLPYPIRSRTRFSEAVAAGARIAAGRLLGSGEDVATGALAERLAVPEGTRVWRLETLSAADGVPLSASTHWVPADRFPTMPAALADSGSFTRALAAQGVADYRRRTTRITARPADEAEAALLGIAPTATLLVTDNVDVDPDGRPVQASRTVFVAERVELVVET
jgi:GntR family transcriptional regulator, phosphonate transport system regulatory protein